MGSKKPAYCFAQADHSPPGPSSVNVRPWRTEAAICSRSDRDSSFRNQKQVLGTSTELRRGLNFRAREHWDKIVRKKKIAKMCLDYIFSV